MKFIKRISIILISIIFLFTIICSASSTEDRQLNSYTYSYYLNFMNDTLFPSIEKYISNNMIIFYDEEYSNKLSKEILDIIESYMNSNDILIPKTEKYYVKFMIIHPSNDIYIYYINVLIPFIEYDRVSNMTSIIGISKNFFCGKEIILKKKII